MPGPYFEPSRRTIEDLLAGSDYYFIPRFQRPYSWDAANIEDFWRDALEDNAVGYFIGPMVGWRSNPRSPDIYVVDGQQRLTTILLILAAIRNALRQISNENLANGIHRFIEKPDRDNTPRFVLQTEGRTSFLDSVFSDARVNGAAWQDQGDGDSAPFAFTTINSHLGAALEFRAARAARTQQLRQFRDKLLGLRVIWIEHSNEDDAYVIFETLNSRGKDLEVVDLLKNHLLNLLRRGGNPRADPAKEQWNRMRTMIEETQAEIDVNRFLQHWWLSQEPFVSQRKLFRAIKSAVRTQPQARQRLGQLSADAPLYRAIFEPDYRTWGPEEIEIKLALEALVAFGVTQPAPLLLALLRARRDRLVTLRQLRVNFTTIARFHFQFTAIARQASSGGIGEMYARCARDISDGGDQVQRAARLRELRQILVGKAPDEPVFTSGFIERLVLTDELSREKKLVQYVLKGLLEHSRPHTKIEGGTVEHILPQAGRDPQVVGSIGNLLWIGEELNNLLANRSFTDKQTILKRYRAQYDVDDVMKAKQWGEPEIRARAKRLANRARGEVWRLPA
jgi:hypothetical protein